MNNSHGQATLETALLLVLTVFSVIALAHAIIALDARGLSFLKVILALPL